MKIQEGFESATGYYREARRHLNSPELTRVLMGTLADEILHDIKKKFSNEELNEILPLTHNDLKEVLGNCRKDRNFDKDLKVVDSAINWIKVAITGWKFNGAALELIRQKLEKFKKMMERVKISSDRRQ
jgi:hypothetical protein